MLIPTIFAAVRGEGVGTDTPTYVYLYEVSNLMTYDEFITSPRISVEPFYYLCSVLGSKITGVSTVFFIYQGLSVLFLYNVAYRFRRYLQIAFVFFLYFIFIYPYSLNITRQCLAMMYLLWISLFLLDRRYVLFFVGSILGVFIHSSIFAGILIYLWCYFIYIVGRSKRAIVFSVSIVILLLLSLCLNKIGSILDFVEIGQLARYSNYLMKNSSYVGRTDLLIRLLFIIFIYLSYKYKMIGRNVFQAFFMLLCIEILMILCGSMATVIFRLALYGTSIDIVLIPYLLCSHSLNKNSRLQLQWSFIVLCLIYWWYTMAYNGTNEIIPYNME